MKKGGLLAVTISTCSSQAPEMIMAPCTAELRVPTKEEIADQLPPLE
eukprot:CAMPEP_0170621520 /NCGR_PEP_ID=MMETSP0224-20130122/28641_1 /TAXON_ID=285029 /ORGANISM="Togula jolla, Strain CCCM 725" /LENGTH=46 /DNA_ID= /DNA_START= /DNA_END= /DNA_ORIENTATION=